MRELDQIIIFCIIYRFWSQYLTFNLIYLCIFIIFLYFDIIIYIFINDVLSFFNNKG